MEVSAAISKILTEVEGAVDAVVFDDDIAAIIKREEESVRSQAGLDVINRAYEETYKRKIKICIFCDRKISTHEDSSLTLEDPEGNVLGMILPASKVAEYRDRKDVIWVSDDFIMFPNVPPMGGERFILHPMAFDALTKEEGCHDVVMSSPAPSSDILIKKHYGVNLNADLATMIVGYNLT